MVATSAVDVRHRPQERKDLWWLEPTVIVVVLGLFVLYSVYAGVVGTNYYFEPYLSPLYSPCLSANCVHPTLPLIGTYWNLSPAILIVAFPLAFRVTCYYYRRSYYRAFFWSPPACAVPDARQSYGGETRFPTRRAGGYAVLGHKLHRGVYPGATFQVGAERFLKALPSTSVEVSLDAHYVLARRDAQFPSGWNSKLVNVGIRVGGNYYFVPNPAKKKEEGAGGVAPTIP